MNTKNRLLLAIMCLVSAGYMQAADLPVPEAEKALAIAAKVRPPEVNKELWMEFYKMIKAGDVADIRSKLEGGANPNCFNEFRIPILNVIIKRMATSTAEEQIRLLRILDLFIKHGADVNIKMGGWWGSVIEYNILESQVENIYPALQKLIEAGAQVTFTPDNERFYLLKRLMIKYKSTQALLHFFVYQGLPIPTVDGGQLFGWHKDFVKKCTLIKEIRKDVQEPVKALEKCDEDKETSEFLNPECVRTCIAQYLFGEEVDIHFELNVIEDDMEAEIKEKEQQALSASLS